MSSLEDKKFGEDFLHKIQNDKITPKPRWRFLLKNSIIWGLGVFSLILGSVSMSLIYFMISNEDTGAYKLSDSSLWEILLIIVPFFWIICLVIFAFAVYYYIKHTKKGYKYSANKIIFTILAASLFFGGILNAFGLDRIIDDTLGQKAPYYDRVINPRLNYWSSPENGRLTGLVVAEVSPVEYDLIDRGGEAWVTLLTDEDGSGEMVVNRPVRLVGKNLGGHKFMVKEVLPVGPGRGFFKRPLSPRMPMPCNDKNDHSTTCNFEIVIPPNQ